MNAPVFMNHDEEYPEGYLATILKEVKTIAMVGASANPRRSRTASCASCTRPATT